MDKLWKVSRGPIAATELDVKKSEAINAMLIHPIGVLPSKVGDPIRPFALGLFQEIRSLLNSECGVTALRRATGAYVRSKRYYFASAQPDSMRHDIHGNPVEPLTTEDRSAAQQRFLSLKQDRTEDISTQAATPSASPQATRTEQIRAALLGRRADRR
ncbi:ProQ/FINO family protein [Neorhizobium sp. DT-125]|uniref:ProQ/FINO family protein n=1 Tax=Neorhizobium sp. DT-125 TaxID=3396163 RepID=UPI003F1DF56D